MAGLNPLIFDVAFIVLLVVSLLIGFWKGFNKLFLNSFLKLIAFILAFTPTLNFLKKFILKYLNVNKFFQANNPILDYFIGVLQVFLVSLVLFFILYLVLKLIVAIFKKIFHYGLKKQKRMVNRIFGAFGNLIVSFITLVILLTSLSTPLIPIAGLDTKIGETAICSKLVELQANIMSNEKVQSVIRTERVVLVLIDGNLFYHTPAENMDAYRATYDNLILLLDEANRTAYYDVLFSTTSTPEEKQVVYDQFISNIVVFTNTSLMIKDQYPDIVGLSDNLLHDYISWIPTGQVITVEATLKAKVVANMISLDGAAGIRNRVFEIINHS